MRLPASLAVLFLAIFTIPTQADPQANKLSVALSTAERLDHSYTLSVDADKVSLAKDADPILPGASVDQVSIAYDRSERDFGLVRAVAPSTMVVINTAPDEPDIYQGMPPNEDFVLLADSLTDSQWQAFTSSGGLAVSDLNGKQRQMFMALLPHGKLKVSPWYGNGMFPPEDQDRDLTGSLDQARIRVARSVEVDITYKNGSSYGGGLVLPMDRSDRWKLVSRDDYGGSQDTVYGVRVRAEVPNEPKSSQLDYTDAAFSVPVSLDGLRTVADLVAAIAKSTNRELYADARLEDKTLTVLPPKPGDGSVPTPNPTAGDLLQALAYCVTGTWRQVGPAYILTDDISGIGTRTQLWYEFERRADFLRKEPLYAAGEDLLNRRKPSDISWFDAPEAFTPDELKSAGHWAGDDDNKLTPPVNTTFDQMTPPQRTLALLTDKQFAHDYDWQYKHDNLQPPSGQDKVSLMPAILAQLIVPTLRNPVDMDVQLDDDTLFRVPPPNPFQRATRQPAAMTPDAILAYLNSHPQEMERMQKQNPKLLDRLLHPPTGPAPTLTDVLSVVKHRAVILSVPDGSTVASEIDDAKALGFNEVWLMVFEHGVATVGGSTLSPKAPLVNGQDMLDDALAEGTKVGVDVYPCLNLLTWGASPPDGASDYNILGEDSKQPWARERAYALTGDSNIDFDSDLASLDRPLDESGIAVNAFSPQVGPALVDLIKDMASRVGVKGMVWRETSPTGYGPVHPEVITSSLTLGYNEELRLGFIRQCHVDPVDIVSPNYYTGKADTSLPMFDPNGMILNPIVPKWLEYRHQANEDFMKTLYDIARPSDVPQTEQIRVIVKARGRMAGMPDDFAGNYETWDDRDVIPSLHSGHEGATMDQDQKPAIVEQHSLVYDVMSIEQIEDFSADTRSLQDRYSAQAPAAFVVDLTGDDVPSGDPMKILAGAMGLNFASQQVK